jgi:hypothetical protein
MFDYFCTLAQDAFSAFCYLLEYGCACHLKSRRIFHIYIYNISETSDHSLLELQNATNRCINARMIQPILLPQWAESRGMTYARFCYEWGVKEKKHAR